MRGFRRKNKRKIIYKLLLNLGIWQQLVYFCQFTNCKRWDLYTMRRIPRKVVMRILLQCNSNRLLIFVAI